LRWTQLHPIRRAIEANVSKGSYIVASFVAPHIHADVLRPYAILFLTALVPEHPVAEAVALRDQDDLIPLQNRPPCAAPALASVGNLVLVATNP